MRKAISLDNFYEIVVLCSMLMGESMFRDLGEKKELS